jgi:hypothetical protein
MLLLRFLSAFAPLRDLFFACRKMTHFPVAFHLHVYLQNRYMKKKDYAGIAPAQRKGEKIDTESSLEFDTPEEAQSFFEVAKKRLLNVNRWHELAGKFLARFHLTNANGRQVNRELHEGDYLKIDIPGPGSKSGEGYDWVQVEKIDEISIPEVQSIGIRVRPAPNPQNKTDAVSHFYSDQSTSNFIITREGNNITAAVYDRNISTNEKANNLPDKARNKIIGGGAMAMFSKLQWKQLADGLLRKA